MQIYILAIGEIINGNTDSLCNPGHMGPICDVCKKGWAKNDGVCFECPENTTTTMSLTILIPIVCIFLVIFLIKTANPSTNKKRGSKWSSKIFYELCLDIFFGKFISNKLAINSSLFF